MKDSQTIREKETGICPECGGAIWTTEQIEKAKQKAKEIYNKLNFYEPPMLTVEQIEAKLFERRKINRKKWLEAKDGSDVAYYDGRMEEDQELLDWITEHEDTKGGEG